MAVKAEKQINSFIKGLITESSPLTYPENASLDEDNFVLNRDGSRSRRLGVDYEDDYTLRDLGVDDYSRISFHEWDIAGQVSISIGVVRIYNKLWFLNMLDRSPSTNLLNGGLALTVPLLASSEISTTVVNNTFIIVSKDLPNPVRLAYNPNDDTVSSATYSVLVRDFWGAYDGLVDNERPTVLSKVHKYNLRNQGWSTTIQSTCGNDAIDCTYNSQGKFPSNCDVWTYGKVADSASANYEKYDPAEMVKRMHDFTVAPKGKFVIDAFNRGASRAEASLVSVAFNPVYPDPVPSVFGTALQNLTAKATAILSASAIAAVDETIDLPQDKETGPFTAVASYAGRVFYSGVRTALVDGDARSPNYSGYVFFTQTVISDDRLTKCYQEADPTSEDISDIVDTDGGTIQITDAVNIVALIPTKNALLVFAENGVWQISGGQANFSATEYDLSKISSIGCKNKHSIVAVNSEVFYWAKGGIYRIVFDDNDGGLKSENLSLTSIQTLYTNIPDLAKEYAKGVLEEKENKIRWLYNDIASSYIGQSKYNRELVLDLTLGAFYTNTIDSSSIYIADFVKLPDYAESAAVDEVVVGVEPVLVTSLDEVVISSSEFSTRVSQFKYLVVNPTTAQFTLAEYRSRTFYDWFTATGGINYSSYLVTGYDIFGEVLRKKRISYLLFYFDRTEDGFIETDGALTNSNPSSCLVQAQWNWANSANSGKWGREFQAYRLLRNYIPLDVNDQFDYGDRVIVTKNKLRGSGRALSLKISSEEGKDMKLLGWAMTVIGDSVP